MSPDLASNAKTWTIRVRCPCLLVTRSTYSTIALLHQMHELIIRISPSLKERTKRIIRGDKPPAKHKARNIDEGIFSTVSHVESSEIYSVIVWRHWNNTVSIRKEKWNKISLPCVDFFCWAADNTWNCLRNDLSDEKWIWVGGVKETYIHRRTGPCLGFLTSISFSSMATTSQITPSTHNKKRSVTVPVHKS